MRILWCTYLLCLLVTCQGALIDLWDTLNIWKPHQVPYEAWKSSNISQECQIQMQQFVSDIIDYKEWALKMLDASGRPSGKLMYGNRLWLGSRVQCEEVKLDVNTTLDPIFTVVHFSTKLHRPYNLQFNDVSLGVCIPGGCDSSSDVETMIEIMVAPKRNTLYDFNITKVKILPVNHSILADPVFILMVTVCSVMFLLMIAATVLDVILTDNSRVTQLLPQNKMRFLLEATLSFSLRRNVSRFFSPGSTEQEGALVVVHGLRVISFSWVITCHTCLCILHFADNPNFRATAERDFLMQMLTSGTFSVDTFFFISGLLIAYVFLRLEKDSQEKKKSSNFMKFIWICIYRFVRLTPPYAFVIGLVIVSMRQYVNNSVFEAPNLDLHDNCELYWWRNLLYINTFYPGQQMCMGWSWYLSIDSQLYIMATALLIIFLRRPRVACVLALSLVLSSWMITASISVRHALTLRLDQPFALYDFLYDKPWTRMGPYIIGMTTGWLLVNKKCAFKMNKFVVFTGWSLALVTMFILVHALHGDWLDMAGSAAYVALSHSLWGICIAWTLIACTTGHGGWITKFLGHQLMIPFSRGTYCGYLIHSAVIQWVFLNLDASITMSRDLITMLFIGFFISSYCLGVIISVTFEAPFTSLLSLARKAKTSHKILVQAENSNNNKV